MSRKPTQMKATATKNYRLFQRSNENRCLNLPKHKPLLESMKKYGYIKEYPIICLRNGSNTLYVKDGQHRLAFAEELGLPVWYTVTDLDFDIAMVNNGQSPWVIRDYAEKFASNGLKAYQELIEFSDSHGLSIGVCASLLGGTVSFSNVRNVYYAGEFKIKDLDFANTVASLYAHYKSLSSAVANMRFLQACVAICRVADLDIDRMYRQGEKCRDKLVAYSNRDAYMQMLEEVYNYGRSKLCPLKMKAIESMRDRDPIVKRAKAKKAKES